MGVFFNRAAGGPDIVGGIFPITQTARCWNRSGGTLTKGDVVQLALTPGIATEIATNDQNSYKLSASNDTIWNTVVLPVSNTAQGSGICRGGIFGVCLSPSVADNGQVDVQFFGVVEEAFCIKAGTDNTAPGDPMSVTAAKNFTGVVNSNQVTVATYIAPQTNLTNRRVRRVLLHQGLFQQSRGQNGATAFT